MAHIHTEKDQHDHTVGAYIIRINDDKPTALLHMHRKLKRLLPIGGYIELSETPWQALAHELKEESGYVLDDLELLQPRQRILKLSDVILRPYPLVLNTHEVTPGHNHTDTGYAFLANGLPRYSVGDGESTDLRWLTQTELNELGDSEIFTNTQEIYNFIFDVCLNNWEKVSTNNFEC